MANGKAKKTRNGSTLVRSTRKEAEEEMGIRKKRTKKSKKVKNAPTFI